MSAPTMLLGGLLISYGKETVAEGHVGSRYNSNGGGALSWIEVLCLGPCG